MNSDRHLIMLLGVAVPFVLLTDCTRFFAWHVCRAGRRAVQTERFVVRYLDAGAAPRVAPAEVGWRTGVPAAHYYYRGETDRLLQRLHGLHPRRAEAAEWQLLRITTPPRVPAGYGNGSKVETKNNFECRNDEVIRTRRYFDIPTVLVKHFIISFLYSTPLNHRPLPLRTKR
jgi:hypothetical protein